MIKSELVTRIALANPHMYQREAEAVVNAFVDEIADAMREGNRVELRGFGSFSVRWRKARLGRNPRTGSAVDVEEKAAPFFRVGKELRDRINGLRGRGRPQKVSGAATADDDEGEIRQAAE